MKTRIITAKDGTLTHEELSFIKKTIKGGGLCIIPTETVYGLGADATSKDAARAIYRAKDRPSNNPLIIHIADPTDAEKYCVTSELYDKLKCLCRGASVIFLFAFGKLLIGDKTGVQLFFVVPRLSVAPALIYSADRPYVVCVFGNKLTKLKYSAVKSYVACIDRGGGVAFFNRFHNRSPLFVCVVVYYDRLAVRSYEYIISRLVLEIYIKTAKQMHKSSRNALFSDNIEQMPYNDLVACLVVDERRRLREYRNPVAQDVKLSYFGI